MKYTLLKMAALALLPALAHAAPAPNIPKDFGVGVTKQQKSQNRIGLTLGRLQSQLDSVITEYKNNGLKGDDLDSLEKFSKMLKTLSESEVKAIIAKLEKAKQKKTDLKEASTPATEAFKGQKHVLGKLHEIYLEWQREQIYRELADRYRALAGTQNQNMRSAARLHKKTGSIKSRLTGENVQTDLRLQQLDQVAIEEEAAVLQKRIEVLDKKESYYIEPRPRLALRKIKSELSPAMEMAKTSLNENLNLEAAAEAELQAKRAMEAIAKLLSPARDKEEILRQALADIGRISADQDKILENTKALETEDGQELGFEQGDLVEQTDSVLQDVGDLVPEAAGPLENATDSQQFARAQLAGAQPAAAAGQQAAAQESLGDAAAAVQAALDALAPEPGFGAEGAEGAGEGQGEGEGEGAGEGQGEGEGQGQGALAGAA